MNIDYEKIEQSVNEYGKYIVTCIKNQYSFSLTEEQLSNIEELLKIKFIVIEKPTKEDIEFFSKQAGINFIKKTRTIKVRAFFLLER